MRKRLHPRTPGRRPRGCEDVRRVAIQVPYAYPTNAAPAMETPASKRVGAVDERGASDVRAVVTKRSRPLKRQKVCDGGVDGAADAASGVLVSDADPCCDVPPDTLCATSSPAIVTHAPSLVADAFERRWRLLSRRYHRPPPASLPPSPLSWTADRQLHCPPLMPPSSSMLRCERMLLLRTRGQPSAPCVRLATWRRQARDCCQRACCPAPLCRR
jgi:hypothetical protein